MKNKMTCIIVDDEKESREGLNYMLRASGDIEVLEICRDGIEAVEAINELKPDLILLDIQMPRLNGFEVLHLIKSKPEVIFITAYDKYALRAFEVHAIDYLLKPFSNQRFFEALEWAREKVRLKKPDDKLDVLVKDYLRNNRNEENIFDDPARQRLVIKADGDIHFIQTGSILWIEAYDYYIKIHVEDQFYLVRESMKSILAKLPKDSFVRTHKSVILNLMFLDRIIQKSGPEALALLSNGKKLKVSRNYKSDLLELLNK